MSDPLPTPGSSGFLDIVLGDDTLACRYTMSAKHLQTASLQALSTANEWASRFDGRGVRLTTDEVRDNALAIDEWNRSGVHLRALADTVSDAFGLARPTGRTRIRQTAGANRLTCWSVEAQGFDAQAIAALGSVEEDEERIHGALLHMAESMYSLHLPTTLRHVQIRDRRSARAPPPKRMRM